MENNKQKEQLKGRTPPITTPSHSRNRKNNNKKPQPLPQANTPQTANDEKAPIKRKHPPQKLERTTITQHQDQQGHPTGPNTISNTRLGTLESQHTQPQRTRTNSSAGKISEMKLKQNGFLSPRYPTNQQEEIHSNSSRSPCKLPCGTLSDIRNTANGKLYTQKNEFTTHTAHHTTHHTNPPKQDKPESKNEQLQTTFNHRTDHTINPANKT